VFDVAVVPSDRVAGGTTVGIAVGLGDEVLLTEAPLGLGAEVSGLGQIGVTPTFSQASTSRPE